MALLDTSSNSDNYNYNAPSSYSSSDNDPNPTVSSSPTSTGISGNIHRNWVTNDIDRIGCDAPQIDAYGNLISIGDNKVEYEWGHYGERDHIKSIGGESVKYDFVTGRLKSVGDKEVNYDYITGDIKSIGD